MSVDVREQALARLAAIIAAVPGLATAADGSPAVGRNVTDVSGTLRPAILLQDGAEDEIEIDGQPRVSSRRIMVMELKPELNVLVGGPAANVGPSLSALRQAILPLILLDAELNSIVGTSATEPRTGRGEIRYTGCEVSTEAGESRAGRMTLNLALRYRFAISDLQ